MTRFSYLQATVLQFAPGKAVLPPDNYRSLQVASVCEASFPGYFRHHAGAGFDEIVPTYIFTR